MSEQKPTPPAPQDMAGRKLAAELDAMLKEAGLRPCFCNTCKHQADFGPCPSCWCKNKPRTNTPAPPAPDDAEEAATLRKLRLIADKYAEALGVNAPAHVYMGFESDVDALQALRDFRERGVEARDEEWTRALGWRHPQRFIPDEYARVAAEARIATTESHENRVREAESHVKGLDRALARVETERDEARLLAEEACRRYNESLRVVTCAFCGEAYPPDTPASGAAVLEAHIKGCQKHPMRNAEHAARLAALREAAGLTCPECHAGLPVIEAGDNLELLSRSYVSPEDRFHFIVGARTGDRNAIKCRASGVHERIAEEEKQCRG